MISVVEVSTQRRDDGGLRMWSEEMPGLILSGEDHDAVVADASLAIAALMSGLGYDIRSVISSRTLPWQSDVPTRFVVTHNGMIAPTIKQLAGE